MVFVSSGFVDLVKAAKLRGFHFVHSMNRLGTSSLKARSES